MGFTGKFDTISEILNKKYKVYINRNDYDGYIVKKMAESNCLKKGISSKQSHIAITGEQMDLFPYIYSKKFIQDNEVDMKNFFVFKAPVNIFKKNCEKIQESNIDFSNKEVLKEEMCIYPRKHGDQIQLSMIQNGDSENFLKFRKLIKPNDYFVVMKKNSLLEYDVFIIENKYIPDNSFKSIFEHNRKGEQNRNNTKDITFVKDDDILKKYSFNQTKINKPYQRIFFGAPGTGKSHRLNEEAKEYFGNNYERVTFHPNYMYSNFIGVFKPFPIKGKGDLYDIITYKYVPGILLKMILKALKNPTDNYLLIIEEINRANVSSVFGEFFQLLDRNKNGDSQYHINITEDIKLYIQEQLQNCEQNIKNRIISIIGETYDKLILPKNLYIWATMNSADQGVMPLDTAFKRRWEFEYIGIDEGENKISDKYYFKISQDGTTTSWNNFRKEINDILSKCRVPEDKLIGPYFISKHILEESNIDELTQIISNKVLMYLYEDVGRAHRNQIFKQEYSRTFSMLRNVFIEDMRLIFKDELNLLIISNDNLNKVNIKNPIVTIEMENGDIIKLELMPEVAPNTVNNFISLINKGFYNGSIFHIVNEEFIVGGFSNGNDRIYPGYYIDGEFASNNFENNLKHKRGVISMIKVESASFVGSEFFILTKDRPDLDGNYASFGNVIEGIEIVDKIATTTTDNDNKPIETQKIMKVTVDTFGKMYEEPKINNMR